MCPLLTLRQVDGVFSFFDQDQDGYGIDYGDFCWTFYNRRTHAKEHKVSAVLG